MLSVPRGWVQFLVRELRSPNPRSVTDKTTTKNFICVYIYKKDFNILKLASPHQFLYIHMYVNEIIQPTLMPQVLDLLVSIVYYYFFFNLSALTWLSQVTHTDSLLSSLCAYNHNIYIFIYIYTIKILKRFGGFKKMEYIYFSVLYFSHSIIPVETPLNLLFTR